MKRIQVLLACVCLVGVVVLTSCGGGGGGSTPIAPPPPPPPPATLTITSGILPEAVEGVAYSQQLQATGGSAPYTWSTTTPFFLTPGLGLSTAGLVSGTSTYSGQKSGFSFFVTVQDSAGRTATASIQMSAAGKLRFTSSNLQPGNANVFYPNNSLGPLGGAPPYTMSLVSGALPAGLSLNSGILTGTPTEFGTFNFSVQIADSDSPPQSGTFPFVLTIAHDFAFPAQTLPIAVLNKAYSAQLRAVNGTPPYTFALLPNSTLTPGLTMSPSGLVNGSATTQANSFFFVQVADSSSPPAVVTSGSLLVLVSPPLSFSVNALDDGVQSKQYFSGIVPGGGIAPYTTTIISGAPPAGINATIAPIAGSVQIFGTPSTLGTSSFTLQVTDSETPPDVVTKTYSIRINPALLRQFPPLGSAIVGKPYTPVQLAATGGVPPYHWTLNSVGLGFTLDASSGVLSGTPTRATNGLTITISDSASPPQSTIDFNPLPVADALKMTTTGLPQVVSGSNVDMQLRLVGGTGPFGWAVSSGALPAGLGLSQTGNITGNVTGASSTFTVSVSDQGPPLQTLSAQYTLNVAAALARNDSIANATPLSNGTYFASLSPIADPPGATAAPDIDVYKINADPGAVVKIEALRDLSAAMDPVIEITDASGLRLQTCNTFGAGLPFNLACMNDDNPNTQRQDSILYFQAPSTASAPVDIYLKVLDFRGDARPDMTYVVTVDGAR